MSPLCLDRRGRLFFQHEFGFGLSGAFVVLNHGEFGESKDQVFTASAQRGQIASNGLASSSGTQRQQRGHRAKPSS